MRHPPLRLLVTTAAVVAVVGAVVAIASARTASNPSVIRFTLTRTGGFFPHARPSPGSMFGATERVVGNDGSTGTGLVLCTYINNEFCSVEITTSKGLITLQGVSYQVNRNRPLVVNGGTGAYAVARGKAAITDVNQKTTNIAVTLAN